MSLAWHVTPPARGAVRDRGAAVAAVVVLHLLLLLALLHLAPPPTGREIAPRQPMRIDLLPDAQVAPARTRRETKTRQAESGATPARPAAVAKPSSPPKPPVSPPAPPVSSIWSKVILLSRDEMAAADIGRMPASGRGEGKSGAGAGRDEGDAGPGRGPNGEPLYNADWQRRPTRAELAFYMPGDAPRQGWGMIACRTVARYRVEDCREVAESPVGSGLASAVRQAAWQFRVLPPRRGGRNLTGAWVRIRIEYSEAAE